MQVFRPSVGAQLIVGVVGQLQLEVLISRLEHEYKVDARLEPSPCQTARWIASDDARRDEGLRRRSSRRDGERP